MSKVSERTTVSEDEVLELLAPAAGLRSLSETFSWHPSMGRKQSTVADEAPVVAR